MRIVRQAVCLLLAGTLLHAQFYVPAASAEPAAARVRQTRIAQRTRPGATRSRRISAAVRAMVSGSVGRTHALMRNDATTREAIANQAGDVDSILPNEPGRELSQASAGAPAAAPQTLPPPRVYTPDISTNDRLAAIRRRGGLPGNVSDAARAAADDPDALLLIGPAQRDEIIQAVRAGRLRVGARPLVRVTRAGSGQQTFVELSLDPEFEPISLLPIDLSGVDFSALTDLVENEFRQAVGTWLSEDGLLAVDYSAPQALIDRASRADVQTAINAITDGVRVGGLAGQLASNRRVLLLLKKTFARAAVAGLAEFGVSADAVVSTEVDAQTGVAIRYLAQGKVETLRIRTPLASILAAQVPRGIVDSGFRLGETLEDELTYAVKEYLRNPDVALASAEDILDRASDAQTNGAVATNSQTEQPTGARVLPTNDGRTTGNEAIARLLTVPLARASRASRRVLVRSIVRDAKRESDEFLSRLAENPNDEELTLYDSLIVGGGVHGASLATTLNREDEDHRAIILEQSETLGANFGLVNDAVTLNSRNDADSDAPLTRGRGNINPVAGPVQVPDIAGNRWTSARALAEVTAISAHTSGARLALGSEFERWDRAPDGARAKYVVTFKQKSTGRRFRVLSNRIVFATGVGEADLGLTDDASVALIQSERARFNELTPDERPQITTADEEARLNSLSATPRDAYRARGARNSAPRTLYTGFGDYSRVNLETQFGLATPDLYDGDGQTDFAQRGEVGDATFLTGNNGPETCNELLDGSPGRNLQGSRARYSQLISPLRSGRLQLQRGRLTKLTRITSGPNAGKVMAMFSLPPSVAFPNPALVQNLGAALRRAGVDVTRVVRVEDSVGRLLVTVEQPDGSSNQVLVPINGYLQNSLTAEQFGLLPEALRDIRLAASQDARTAAPLFASVRNPVRARSIRTAAGLEIEFLLADGTSETLGPVFAGTIARDGDEDRLLGAARYAIAQRGVVGDVYDRVVLGTGFRSTLADKVAPNDAAARETQNFVDSPAFNVVAGEGGRPVAKRYGMEDIYVVGAALGQSGIVQDGETRAVNENRASIFLLEPRTEEFGRITARETKARGRTGNGVARFPQVRTDFGASEQRDFRVTLPSRPAQRTFRAARERNALGLELKARVADVLDQFRFVGVPRVRVTFTRDQNGALSITAPGMREGDVARLGAAFAADTEARDLIESATAGGADEELSFTAQTRSTNSRAYEDPQNRANQWTIRPGSVRVSGM